MLDPELLKLLCCPETYQPLHLADACVLDLLNQKVRTGTLSARSGRKISEPLTGGLVRADGKLLYPIRKEIPVMLIEEAIPLA
jgi:uncharacterized protein YbaR (Trm112 family)